MAPHQKGAVRTCGIPLDGGERTPPRRPLLPETGTSPLADLLDDGICLIDAGGRVRWINRALEEFFGVGRDTVEGMPIADFLVQVVSPALIEPQGGIPKDFHHASPPSDLLEIRIASHLEGPLWIEYSGRPFPGEDGRVWRMDLFRRINRWKVAEHHFMESEERYRLLFNKGNDAVLVFSLSADRVPDRLLEVNDIACSRFGYTRQELLELSPLSLVPSDMIGAVLRILKRGLRSTPSFFKRSVFTPRFLVEFPRFLRHTSQFTLLSLLFLSRKIATAQAVCRSIVSSCFRLNERHEKRHLTCARAQVVTRT
ncbi:PAS domain-containing protein [Methanofollis tationis]|uniref:PAS domain S-box protein n=1 Tax=Methanofollis tationis TaxID=81417 RepID=A0A7K4HLW4_9EURY|nr:PAS domain-containing protein [Methanofollis tationis]NVO65920.1 PAS domain S-box protein [Methanofollis tationis]